MTIIKTAKYLDDLLLGSKEDHKEELHEATQGFLKQVYKKLKSTHAAPEVIAAIEEMQGTVTRSVMPACF